MHQKVGKAAVRTDAEPDHLHAHFDKDCAGRFLPEIIVRIAAARDQCAGGAHELGIVVAIVEDRPGLATLIHRVENEVGGLVVEALDEGPGEVEDDTAVAPRPRLCDDLLELGCLACTGGADEHRVALFKAPGEGDTSEPIGLMQPAPRAALEVLLENRVRVLRWHASKAFLLVLVPVVMFDRRNEHITLNLDRTALMTFGENF